MMFSKIHKSGIHFFLINLFGQLLDIFPKNVIFLKTFDSEFSWFTDQNYKLLEIKDKINTTLVINESVKYKK